MIDYTQDPMGDVVWTVTGGGSDGRIARISLSQFLEIAAHTITEAEFRRQVWMAVTFDARTDKRTLKRRAAAGK